MWLRIMLFGAVLAFLLMLAVASTLTTGFTQWCSSFPAIDGIRYVSVWIVLLISVSL